MLLTESAGKRLLAASGIPTPRGVSVRTEAEMLDVAAAIEGPVVLKAQVLAGGRGKGGGIKVARDAGEVGAAFRALHGSVVNGHLVEEVLIEEAIRFAAERYVGFLVDCGQVWLLVGARGGIDIEEVSREDPGSIARIRIDDEVGPDADRVASACEALGIGNVPSFLGMVEGLYRCFVQSDATTAEINPVAECPDGRAVALDARIVIDDAALFRHPDLVTGPRAAGHRTTADHLTNLKIRDPGGTIGYAGIGGGLALTVADWLAGRGHEVKALIDVDDGVAAGQAAAVFAAFFDAMAADTRVRAILINVITCGYRTPDIADAVLGGLAAHPEEFASRVVINLHGTGEDEAERVFRRFRAVNCRNIADATDRVVELLEGGRS